MKIFGKPTAKIKIDNKILKSSKINIYDNGNKIVAEERGNISLVAEKKLIQQRLEDRTYIS